MSRDIISVEAYAFLVDVAVFKTDEAEYLGLAGSIPVRLRHQPFARKVTENGYAADRTMRWSASTRRVTCSLSSSSSSSSSGMATRRVVPSACRASLSVNGRGSAASSPVAWPARRAAGRSPPRGGRGRRPSPPRPGAARSGPPRRARRPRARHAGVRPMHPRRLPGGGSS
jgi:hypothetical protein